jgi:hypothetical protein
MEAGDESPDHPGGCQMVADATNRCGMIRVLTIRHGIDNESQECKCKEPNVGHLELGYM